MLVRQTIAAAYRKPFFELLAQRCLGDLTLVAGKPQSGETVSDFDNLQSGNFVSVENKFYGRGVFQRYSQPGLIEAINYANPDIYFSESNPRFADVSKVGRHLKSRKIPAVGWGAGTADFWNKPLKRLRSWYRNRSLRHYDAMVCYSTVAASQYQEVGFSKDQTIVLFNSTMRRPETTSSPQRGPVVSPVKLVFIGRLIDSKGIDRLVKSATIVQKRGHELIVNIVGDGPAKTSLEKLAKEIGAPVDFLGRREGDELAEISRSSDLFVLPGLGGLAIQEAMAHGLPVIVTEADGTEQDLVRSNGWVAKKEDVDALADCIEQAISDPEQLRRKGDESFRIVKEEINLDLMVDRFVRAANVFSGQCSTDA